MSFGYFVLMGVAKSITCKASKCHRRLPACLDLRCGKKHALLVRSRLILSSLMTPQIGSCGALRSPKVLLTVDVQVDRDKARYFFLKEPLKSSLYRTGQTQQCCQGLSSSSVLPEPLQNAKRGNRRLSTCSMQALSSTRLTCEADPRAL